MIENVTKEFIEWMFTPPKAIYRCCNQDFFNHYDYHKHTKTHENSTAK